ncbi:MAG: sugar phosphate isomerase, partial [Bacteroidetes bacterium]|nr:sugar phosphate isomerase [Bacteroidota bacterium]
MKKVVAFYFIMILPLTVIIINGCAKEIKKKDIGLQLWSIRQDMHKDPVKTMEELGKTGYAFVETADYSHGRFYGMSPADFKALVEKNNMRFLSSHT